MLQDLPKGYSVISFDNVDSTNEEAMRLIRAKMYGEKGDKTVLWAKSQSAGRGRMGRKWSSPTGNLYMSLILKPDADISQVPQISFVTALALSEAIECFLPEGKDIQYKWPNDLLVDGKKMAGILLETEAYDKKHPDDWLVVGIGVNIKKFPKNVPIPATSLKEIGSDEITIEQAMTTIVNCFDEKLTLWEEKGFEVVRRKWLKNAKGIGEKIDVSVYTRNYTGIFKGINHEGCLVLSLGGGETKLISGGEVFFLDKKAGVA